MNDSNGYAVFFYPQALEALGEAIKPYLQTGDGDPHVLCNEIDTGGALIEMTLRGRTPDNRELTLELMVPSGMVRMVVSTHSDGTFGFGAAMAAGSDSKPLPSLPPLAGNAMPADARSAELPRTAHATDVPKD